jgi:hypothetical protein
MATDILSAFWLNKLGKPLEAQTNDSHTLPVARIKKVMKSDLDLKNLVCFLLFNLPDDQRRSPHHVCKGFRALY